MQIQIKARLVWGIPYVRDGLVALWDGQWNAPNGVHDPNGTFVFETLSNTQEDVASTFAIGPNYWGVVKASGGNRTTALTSALATAANNGYARLELITAISAPPTQIYGNSYSMLGGTFGYQPNTGTGMLSIGTDRIIVKNPQIIGHSPVRLVIIIDARDRTMSYQIGKLTDTVAISNPRTYANAFYINSVGTKIYSARIYHRPLSEGEIATNEGVDECRYEMKS